jgi:D-3-phosphoglycerate dehydrogenase
MNVLVTCPPMLGMIDAFRPAFEKRGVDVTPAKVVQTLSEDELCELLPQYDGWILGDDPATSRVFGAGLKGKLKAAVKWGIGVDNIDFAACKDLGIPITNCPNMFGGEVADVGMSYLLALARETYFIDRGVRHGQWPKPRGISLTGKVLGLIGFGDIGRSLAKRALACDIKIVAYDPFYKGELPPGVELAAWPDRIGEADFLAFTCALTKDNRHMLNDATLAQTKPGVRITNVARGPLIDEQALIRALQSGHVHSVALDVFEVEPLPMESPLRGMPNTIFGSHNGSNTVDGVVRCSHFAIDTLLGYLGVPECK